MEKTKEHGALSSEIAAKRAVKKARQHGADEHAQNE
jgi:hypothetical protein